MHKIEGRTRRHSKGKNAKGHLEKKKKNKSPQKRRTKEKLPQTNPKRMKKRGRIKAKKRHPRH